MATVEPVALPAGESIRLAEPGDIARIIELANRKTPLGYRNISGPDGKKIIAIEPAIAPLIARLFEWYARGDISLKDAARKAHVAGLTYPKSGPKVLCCTNGRFGSRSCMA